MNASNRTPEEKSALLAKLKSERSRISEQKADEKATRDRLAKEKAAFAEQQKVEAETRARLEEARHKDVRRRAHTAPPHCTCMRSPLGPASATIDG